MVTKTTPFSCVRQNRTTFRIVEADKWSEYPLIYVKIYQDFVIVIDTGCGGAAKDPRVNLKSLRRYVETWPIHDNDGVPLNPGGKKSYLIICTHCHYDHIGAIEQFTDFPKSEIWASSNDRQFIEGEGRLPTSSLCKYRGMQTPVYTVTHWARDMENVKWNGKDTGLRIYHTPGHTPDELAVWDAPERTLYVGDTLYGPGPCGPIILVKESVMKDYLATLGKLGRLLRYWNGKYAANRVTMACGHNTSNVDAEIFLKSVADFLNEILRGRIQAKPAGTFRDEREVLYEQEGGGLSMRGPARLFSGKTGESH